jgi:negative regulator of sigma E activity
MKKTFLTSVALLAASLAVDANAALPESVSNKLPEMTTIQQSLQVKTSFVLERANEKSLMVAAHSSHASHSSHSSHASSRY